MARKHLWGVTASWGAGVLLAVNLHAAEISVGTPAEISAAMASAMPGDTLTMTGGVWTDARIVFAGNGTAGAPITLRAGTPGATTLEGASNLRIGGTYLVVDGLSFRNGYSPSGAVIEFRNSGFESSNCRLTNTSIVDFNPPDPATDYKWVSLYGSHNRVDHCTIKGKSHAGTTLVVWLSATPNYHLIDHNHFALRPPLGVNGGETIRVGTSDWSMYDSFTVVEWNLFEDCNGEAEIISSKSCGNVYRYNTFRRCKGALTLRHGNRCVVEGNFFFGEGVSNTGGIRVIGEDHLIVNNYLAGLKGTGYRSALAVMNGIPNSELNGYFQVKRARILFNTLVDNTSSFDIGVGKDSQLSLPPLDCMIANVAVAGNASPLIRFTDTPLNMQWEGNIFYGASLGITQPAGIVVTDPQLLPADAYGIRRPGPQSPLRDAAAGAYDVVTLDVDGQVRTGLKDIGADEISESAVLHFPLTQADVGPVSPASSVTDEGVSLIPNGCRLLPPFPNPFNPRSTLHFAVGREGRSTLRVYGVLGEEVAILFDEVATPGRWYAVGFDAAHLASGMYLAVLSHGPARSIQKLVVAK